MALKKSSIGSASRGSSASWSSSGKSRELESTGEQNDHYRRHMMDSSYVGESIGFTINEGDYNSLRVDAWGAEEVMPGEDRSEAFKRLSESLDAEVRRLVQKYEQ